MQKKLGWISRTRVSDLLLNLDLVIDTDSMLANIMVTVFEFGCPRHLLCVVCVVCVVCGVCAVL